MHMDAGTALSRRRSVPRRRQQPAVRGTALQQLTHNTLAMAGITPESEASAMFSFLVNTTSQVVCVATCEHSVAACCYFSCKPAAHCCDTKASAVLSFLGHQRSCHVPDGIADRDGAVLCNRIGVL